MAVHFCSFNRVGTSSFPLAIFQRRAFLDGFCNLPQSFFELEGKKNRCKTDGKEICNRFRHIHRCGLIGREQQRQKIDQRDQQNEFAHHRDQNRGFCISQGCKCHLAGDLYAKQQQAGHINAQGGPCELQQGSVRGKHGGKPLREQHHKRPEQGGITQAGLQQQLKGRLHPPGVFGAVVVADDRLRPLSKAL